jgi:hypothetical protein
MNMQKDSNQGVMIKDNGEGTPSDSIENPDRNTSQNIPAERCTGIHVTHSLQVTKTRRSSATGGKRHMPPMIQLYEQ